MHIFLDYDGTLIKTREEDFTKLYLTSLAKRANMDPKHLGRLIVTVTKELIKNQNGKKNIYDQFMKKITDLSGINALKWEKIFYEYYESDFKNLKAHVIKNDKLVESVKNTKNEIIFASNALFPKIAVSVRLSFIDMKIEDFEYLAYMENSHWLKPNPKFFKQIMEKNNLKSSECIMIGDSEFDKSCEKAGIKFIHVENEVEWKKYF
jgi:HAD superfamily hydrolase (TIGR01549 family)